MIRAVEGVGFSCQPGQVYGWLGASNGAGKTTSLRMLATILKPSEGTAHVAGYDIIRQPDQVRQNIGFLFGPRRLSTGGSPRERWWNTLGGCMVWARLTCAAAWTPSSQGLRCRICRPALR